MGKRSSSSASKDWAQIYAVYGVDQWQTLLFLLFHAFLFSLLSLLFLLYFDPICGYLEASLSSPGGARYAAGFAGAVTAISAVCLFFAAGNFLYSAVPLHQEMAQRMVNAVSDWSAVRNALDLGCGRGLLLNAVATQLKKTGSSGRVVGLAPGKGAALATLRTAKMEGRIESYLLHPRITLSTRYNSSISCPICPTILPKVPHDGFFPCSLPIQSYGR